MPTIDVDIEIYCENCGAGLCNNARATRTRKRDEPAFFIEPCEKCIEVATAAGYEQGVADTQQE